MQNYSIVSAGPSNVGEYKTQIESLWKNNLSDPFQGRFEWMYTANPAGPSVTWLALEDGTKSVIGGTSLMPREVRMQGAKLKMGIAADFAVNKEHRVFGPALQLQRELTRDSRKHGFVFNIAFPNKASEGVLWRAGYKVIGEAAAWAKLLRTEQKILPRVKHRGLGLLLSGCMNTLLEFFDLCVKPIMAEVCYTEMLSSCDKRFDALWEETKSEYELAGERSSAFLNWRYGSRQGQFQYFCLCLGAESALKGFVVFTVRKNTAFVFDVFASRKKHVWERLLIEFSGCMRARGVFSISTSYFGDNKLASRLRRLNFIKRRDRRRCFVYTGEGLTTEQKKIVAQKDKWCIFDGEMDV